MLWKCSEAQDHDAITMPLVVRMEQLLKKLFIVGIGFHIYFVGMSLQTLR